MTGGLPDGTIGFVNVARTISNAAAWITLGLLATTTGGAPKTQAASDEDLDALVAKTNLYVNALNAVSNIRRTYDRYASWVDLKKGITGKERYITYGLYDINTSSVKDVTNAAEKGPKLPPPLAELDATIVRLSDAVSALAPLVNKASDYYEQEDYKDDNAALGQELHGKMMPLFEKVFAAERELRKELEIIKTHLDQQQLAQLEKTSGRKYHWYLRSYMIAAKRVVTLLPDNPEARPISADEYKDRYGELESAYNAFQAFTSEHPEEVKKIMMASFVESAAKDFFAASKFLRRTLEAPKLDRREYIERVGELAENYNTLIQRTNNLR